MLQHLKMDFSFVYYIVYKVQNSSSSHLNRIAVSVLAFFHSKNILKFRIRLPALHVHVYIKKQKLLNFFLLLVAVSCILCLIT